MRFDLSFSVVGDSVVNNWGKFWTIICLGFDVLNARVLINALQELGTVLARVGERMTEKELLAMVAEVSTFQFRNSFEVVSKLNSFKTDTCSKVSIYSL